MNFLHATAQSYDFLLDLQEPMVVVSGNTVLNTTLLHQHISIFAFHSVNSPARGS